MAEHGCTFLKRIPKPPSTTPGFDRAQLMCCDRALGANKTPSMMEATFDPLRKQRVDSRTLATGRANIYIYIYLFIHKYMITNIYSEIYIYNHRISTYRSQCNICNQYESMYINHRYIYGLEREYVSFVARHY